jgi:hypothetical protein
MKYDITASIVTYNTKLEDLKRVIDSFMNCTLNIHLYILDNSPNDSLRKFVAELDNKKISYKFNNKNGGYGWGHNRVLEDIKANSKYHLILNPDIYFKKNILEKIYNYMEKNKDVGQVMPLVKYPSGEIQYLCKQLPTPKDLFLRKFCPIKSIVEKNDYKYEMRETGYNKIMEVPILSGCFMFLRTDIFTSIGGFDERFFMYLEDFDLTRRMGEKSKTIFFPEVEIVHAHAKESYKNKKMMWIHIKSTIKYFNKWGWL